MLRIATRITRPSLQLINTASRPTFRSFASQGAQKRAATNLFTRQTKSKELLFQPKRSIGTTKRALQQIPQQVANSANSLNYIVGGVAAAGIAGLAAYGFANSEADPRGNTVTSRIRYTYAYLAGSLGITALAARAFFQSGLALRMAQTNPWVVFGVSLVGMIGAQIAVRAIPYENTIPKHLAFGGFCGIMGAALCPIVAVGGPVILQAAAATGTIVGSLSLVGAAAPEGTFSGMTGPLTIGLGCLLAASMGTMAFPAVGLLQNIVVYGGTALFGFFVLHDTQRVIENAKYSAQYDPINNCLGIYMDTINIFINMVTILSNNRRK